MKEKYIADRQSSQRKMKESTAKSIHYHIDKYLAEWLDYPIKRITPDIIDMKYRGFPQKTTANTTFRYLRAILNYANSLSGDENPVFVRNPVSVLSTRKIWAPPKARVRILSEKEIGLFYSYFLDMFYKRMEAKLPEQAIVPGFLFFVLTTGSRKTESLNLKFEDINDDCAIFRETNTEERTIPLHKVTLSVIEKLKEQFQSQTEYVFPGRNKNEHLKEYKRPFHQFIKTFQLDLFSLHDLRRTFVTVGSQITLSENIKIIVGHNLTGITGIHYYHPMIKDLRKSMDTVIEKYGEFASAHQPPH